ncbi:E3 ubiquitin-protein ligase Topors-like isoform X2 [Oncorhynchus keta]|uniref:E3 ubiquitin-protein ligase Topors-like isoform X2 n=1 Tax=Oncorhynchus keta TaxID=8018 RepID=UPI00227CE57E|nr:E3 ubiquitin-protein ligase Topors-like isoform X2 [Oncorhynchus keta]
MKVERVGTPLLPRPEDGGIDGQWELAVFHGSLVNIVQRIITSPIARRDREGAGSSRMNSTPFQLARLDHFFHELEAFDQLAIYDPSAPTYEDGMTSSTSDTDLSVTSIYDPPAPTYEDGMTSSTSDTDLSVTSIYDPPAPTYEDGRGGWFGGTERERQQQEVAHCR